MDKSGLICVSAFFHNDEEPRRTLKSRLVFEDEYEEDIRSLNVIEDYKNKRRNAVESRKRCNNGNINTVVKKARYEEPTSVAESKESLNGNAKDRLSTTAESNNNDDTTVNNKLNNNQDAPTPDIAIYTHKKDIKCANEKHFYVFKRNLRSKSGTNINFKTPRRTIELPKDIKAKKAVINVKSTDSLSLKWAILSALYPARKHSDRVSSYLMHSNKIKLDGVRLPVQLEDIHKVEELNNISINVFGLEYNKGKKVHSIIGPLFLTKSCKDDHINLLLISGMHNHFCYIKNMSRLLSKQLSDSDHAIFICNACLSYFLTKQKLDKHTCTRIVTELPK